MANIETPQTKNKTPLGSEGEQAREEALRRLQETRDSVRRVLGNEASRGVYVSGPDGVVMTNSDLNEDTRRRREHGGKTPEDIDTRY